MPEAEDGQASSKDFEWHYDVDSEHPIGHGNSGADGTHNSPADPPRHQPSLAPPVHPRLRALKGKGKKSSELSTSKNTQASSSKRGREEAVVKVNGKRCSKRKVSTSPVNSRSSRKKAKKVVIVSSEPESDQEGSEEEEANSDKDEEDIGGDDDYSVRHIYS